MTDHLPDLALSIRHSFTASKIVVTEMATEFGGFNFKPSRYRSKRVFKKLLKRYGSMERRVHAIFHDTRTDTFYMHPKRKAALDAMLKRQADEIEKTVERSIFFGGPAS
jgi:hypothetical protein